MCSYARKKNPFWKKELSLYSGRWHSFLLKEISFVQKEEKESAYHDGVKRVRNRDKKPLCIYCDCFPFLEAKRRCFCEKKK